MSTKDFNGGLDSLIQPSVPILETTTPTQPNKKGSLKTSPRQITKGSQENTKDGETRAAFIGKEPLLDRVKDIAYWERLMIEDIINTALQE
jgi:hypothetical protein